MRTLKLRCREEGLLAPRTAQPSEGGARPSHPRAVLAAARETPARARHRRRARSTSILWGCRARTGSGCCGLWTRRDRDGCTTAGREASSGRGGCPRSTPGRAAERLRSRVVVLEREYVGGPKAISRVRGRRAQRERERERAPSEQRVECSSRFGRWCLACVSPSLERGTGYAHEACMLS